ncbi:DUF4390 domain-containing protein [Undibacterium cyanobacteriorum]|uniref:DUF4390 domain-containing protein n=1 Tax=Undibacterium cyanobacteriorum TaxID=3073561 RepID=A0ABY9RJ46_9BURK|nr:DUF4390 domain-containing protein [Undibacterium sp. 20NA77.5]WMW80685.1 DUF4390 domain-containing protein [Undibacterium sp. 20NA77.5]
MGNVVRSGMLLLAIFCLSFSCVDSVRAEGIEVTTAKLEASDDGYRVLVGFAFELGSDVRAAINEGIPVSFIAEVEINRPRWYWFDEKTIRSTQTIKIQYDLWRRQYTAAVNGGLKQNFTTLDEVINLVKQPRRWLVAEKNGLSAGANYNVAVRLKLDSSQLSKPMLFTSLSNSGWRLSSDWKRFTFKVEEK